MELLEKITLYDLLGYSVPGGVLLFVIQGYSLETELKVFPIVAFIVVSYLIGHIIAVVTSGIISVFWKINWIKNWLYSNSDISLKALTTALRKAGIIEPTKEVTDSKEIWDYYTGMYCDIQVDKDYMRVHNYASAALLYQNMAMSVILCLIIFVKRGMNTSWMIWGLLGVTVIFMLGWYRFDKRVVKYTINWYIMKHIN